MHAMELSVFRRTLPYDTIEDFVAYMKEHPGEVRFSNSGIGGPWHLLSAKFAELAGVDIVHVPCDGGGPAAIAAAGGNVECVPVSDGECKTYLESGLLKMLMTFSPERLADYPDVPTARRVWIRRCFQSSCISWIPCTEGNFSGSNR